MKLNNFVLKIGIISGLLCGVVPQTRTMEVSTACKIIAIPLIAYCIKQAFFSDTTSKPYEDTNPETVYEKNADHGIVRVTVKKFGLGWEKKWTLLSRQRCFYIELFCNNKAIGHANISFQNTSGRLDLIRIFSKDGRKKGLGKILYACAVQKLLDLGCTHIDISAQSYELKDGETVEKLLPDLIRFYQKCGAEVDQQWPNLALMSIKDINKARECIYGILKNEIKT